MSESESRPAYLPEDLLMQMLEKAPKTAKQLAHRVDLDESKVKGARKILEEKGIICECPDGPLTTSIMAADGANIVEHKTGSDIVLAMAVGVDGLSNGEIKPWPKNARQYQQWQTALPHHVANPRLSQGIMFLMELNILSENDREVRVMDGSHLTTILKINSLLSANDNEAADQPYVEILSDFLNETYERIIPDIPDMLRNAFSNDSIVALTKFSSSREIIDSRLKGQEILVDDKVFMSNLLEEGEYTQPLPVGQSEKERAMWKQVHIKCNLKIENVDTDELNSALKESISPFKIDDDHDSELFFCYYRPFGYMPAYRLEIKKTLAESQERLETLLRSLKGQIIPYEIREIYPQYLADIIVKNISLGLAAVSEAIFNDPILSQKENFDLMFPYRTR